MYSERIRKRLNCEIDVIMGNVGYTIIICDELGMRLYHRMIDLFKWPIGTAGGSTSFVGPGTI